MPRLVVPRCDPSTAEVIVLFCIVPEGETTATRSMLSLLSEDERERALRFRFGRDRAAFSCAHLLLRRCLEQITGRPDWSLVEGAYGKPALASALGSPALAFNISHTRGWVACALARGHEVGVESRLRARISTTRASRRGISAFASGGSLKAGGRAIWRRRS